MTKQQQRRQGRQAAATKNALPNIVSKRVAEGGTILVMTMALFALLALTTYHLSDPGWFHHVNAVDVANAGGRVGAYIADALFWFLGYFAFAVPMCLAFFAGVCFQENRSFQTLHLSVLGLRVVGFFMLLLGGCGLLSLDMSLNAFSGRFSAGGVIGQFIADVLRHTVNQQGALLLCFALLLVGVTWATHLSWLRVLELTGQLTVRLFQLMAAYLLPAFRQLMRLVQSRKTERAFTELPSPRVMPRVVVPKVVSEKIVSQAEIAPPESVEPPQVKKVQPIEPPKVKVVGGLPMLKLLEKGQPGKPLGGFTHQELEALSREVEQHLRDFGVMADVVAVHPGPVITRFELQLAAGVKVSKLSALSVDLARSLSVKSVRVVEIIPGKTVVGIELPNMNRATVSLSSVLSSDAYQQAHSPLSMALGVDIAGHPMIVDLGKMPHLLVAGTTGSGKSVGINAMILSLLFKATPEQVRLIMIDPKMLELSVYDGIPHLLTPVVTDMKEAASALRWCVGEMERRYRLMSSLGVRNLAGFNAKLTEAEANGELLRDPLWKPIHGMDTEAPVLQTLPYVVVVIDELADMMMVVGKKVEQLIARIAQKARAAGIHLILATQRPSVDVLTGLIKSNIPTRISFQVSSKIDSRTILDQQGAEQLLGHGDMLFLAPGTGAPLRVHGAYVDDKEVHRVADDWRARGQPEYIEDITQMSGDGNDGSVEDDEQSTEDSDPLYDQAVEFVLQTRKASVSAVQRRFKIGYNRAARLVEEMERTGLVGPLDGGSRDVLVRAEEQG
jgi:S-DNA-T family DNA segregation ATPase FtsK/SpoIIIE